MDLRDRSYLQRAAITSALYLGAVGLSQVISASHPPGAVWIGTGVAVASIFLMGWGMVPVVTVCAMLGTYLVAPNLAGMLGGGIVAAAIGSAGAGLLRYTGFDPRLRTVRDAVLLVTVGSVVPGLLAIPTALLAPVAGANVAGTSLAAAGQAWLGATLGILTIGSLIMIGATLVVGPRPALPDSPGTDIIPVVALTAVAVAPFIPLTQGLGAHPSALALPLLVYAAVRYRQYGAVLASSFVALVAAFGTAYGIGPFAAFHGMQGYIPLQLFMIAAAATAIVLGSATCESFVAEQARLAAERRYRLLVERLPAVTYEAGAIGPIASQYVSPQLFKMLGYTPQEWYDLSGTWADLLHPDDRERVLAAVKLVPEGGNLDVRYRILGKDGTYRWIADYAAMTLGDDGQPTFVGTFFDITREIEAQDERKHDEAIVHEAEARFRAIVENTSDVIATIGSDGRFKYVNPAGARMLGREQAKVVGLTPTEAGFPDSVVDRWRQQFARMEIDGMSQELDVSIPLPGGSRFFSTLLIRDPNEHDGPAVIVMARDFSRRRATELQMAQQREALEQAVTERTAELTTANAQLRELDQLKSMFIASMSHELRTPLNSVIGFSGVLLSGAPGPLTEEQQTQLEMIREAGGHLLGLIGDILDISQVEAGTIEPHPEDFDLADLEAEAAALVRPEAEQRGLAFRLVPEHLAMHSDRRRVLQCLLNLLTNAVKYTEAGEIVVTTLRSGGDVAISVTDTGVGIAPEDRVQAFEPFTRLESPMRATTPGTGLGLYLTRKVADDVLGGTVELRSEPGVGSTFTLTVPVDIEDCRDREGSVVDTRT